MKKHILSLFIMAAVLLSTWDAMAQRRGPGLEVREDPSLERRGGGGRGGFGGGRGFSFVDVESTNKAVAAIEEQLAAIKKALEGLQPPGQGGRPGGDDFRAMMEQMREKSAAIQSSVSAIDDQVLVLKGRQARTEFNESMEELESVAAKAVDENAAKTAEFIQALIQARREAFQKKAEELGIPAQGRRGGFGGGRGSQVRQRNSNN